MSHHRASKVSKSVIVIGAGMGGMAAAARLAKRGHKVKVFEAASFAGGKCRTEDISGFSFDTGPSLLTLPAVYRDLFVKTGKRLENLVQLNPVDPSFTYIFDDGKRVTFPNLSHSGTVLAITESFGAQAGDAWHQLLTRAEKMWGASRQAFVESELRSPFAMLKSPSLLRDLKTIAPFTSLRDLVRSYTDNVYIGKIIDRYATYTGSDPRKVPAVLLTIAFVEEAFGAWHVSGGVGTLAKSLESRLNDLGVELHLNTKVDRIITKSGVAIGVRLANGQVHNSDVVIANADADLVYNQLLEKSSRTRSARNSLNKATASLSGFSLLIGLRGSSELGHHTVFFPKDYDAEFDSIFEKRRPVEDPAIYICNPNDSRMKRAGVDESWSVLINAPRHQPKDGFNWDEKSSKEYSQHIINLMEAKGLDIRSRLEVLEYRSPADLERNVNAPGGSIYGTSSNGARSAFWRARNRSKIKNLFLVGGSTHPGGGLPLVGISAEIVAEAVEENLEQ
jgi:phytoene desaturase